jgi:hypothetical protein
VITSIQKQRRARKGLTSPETQNNYQGYQYRYNCFRAEGEAILSRNGLFSGSEKWEHLYL